MNIKYKILSKLANSYCVRLAYEKITYDNQIRIEENAVKLDRLNITFPLIERYAFLLEKIDLLYSLSDLIGLKLYIQERGEIIAELESGIKLNIQTAEDIFILNEIFSDQVYGAIFSKKVNVFDIGMNVGMASIFFAANKNVNKIYSFEPFADTVKQAKNNLSLNNDLSEKIEINNFGLGSSDKKMKVNYSFENKGRVGVHGTKLVLNKVADRQEVEIQIKDCCTVFKEKLKLSSEIDSWLFKIDCEGSEYEILEALDANQLLSKVNIMMIEWHQRGPSELITIMEKNGFGVFSFYPTNKKAGMIYGIKSI